MKICRTQHNGDRHVEQLIRESKDAIGQKQFKRLDIDRGYIKNKVIAAIDTDEPDHILDTDGEFQDK